MLTRAGLGLALLAQVIAPPQSAWERAQGLAPGADRAQALVRALGELEEPSQLARAYELGFEEFMNQVRAYHMEEALPLAEALHASATAGWSASCLALASTRTGAFGRAREVLQTQLARTAPGELRASLQERLGLASLGAGRERQARRELGSAFAWGSSNAGVVLGKLALEAGRLPEARAVFRGVLEGEPSQSWARRGWALSMLPAPRRDDPAP